MSLPARKRKEGTHTTTKTTQSAAGTAVESSCVTPQRRDQRHSGTSLASLSKQQRQETRISSVSRPTPLARALQAQWTLLQQNLQLGSIPVTAERDLLRVLESLPEHKNTILSDVEGVLPYILAFAVAPIPSERTQVIALGAMQAAVGSIIAVWGKKAAAVLVHDFLTVEHNALHALEVTLSVAFGDDGEGQHDKNLGNVKKGHEHMGKHEWKPGNAFTETHSTIIGSALEFILMMVTISEPTAAALLTHPKLIQTMVFYLPKATPTQACDVANILHTLSAVNGSAEVLVAYRAYQSAVMYIRTSARVGVGGDSPPNATITALCFFLRFVIRLAENPAAFEVIQNDPTMPNVMEELLRSQWVEIIEIGCRWFTTIIERHTAESVGLVSDILSKSQVGEQLANMLLWSSNKVTHAATAALCWRWFALANPALVGSFLVSNPNALFAFVQVVATKSPLLSPQVALGPTAYESKEGLSEDNALYRLLTEVVCTLGISHGLSSRETRKGMRRIILSCLSPVTQVEVQRCVKSIFAGLDELCFDQYPTATVPSQRALVFRVPLSERAFVESASETDVDIDDELTVKQSVGGGKGCYLLHSGDQWRSFLLCSLTHLFRGHAQGIVSVGSAPQRRHILGAVHRVQTPLNVTQNQQGHFASAPTPIIVTSPPSSHLLQQGVVQRAEQMGGSFYLDSIRVILRLAHHYKHNMKKEEFCGPTVSRSVPTSSLGHQGKAPNPWAPPEKLESSRCWSVKDVQRPDALLFYILYENIADELTEALEAVEKHTEGLSRCLQVCPTKAVRRRCVLNDLYLNVYPKIHMFLRFIRHHITRSRPVVQIILGDERAIHSGNILDLYEAIGHCIGSSVSFSENFSIEKSVNENR